MNEYERGDRVAVLYLSKTNGTCLAYNRTVIDVEPHEKHGQRIWVNMPADAASGSPHDFFANDHEGIWPMEDEPIEEQLPVRLAANLDWYIEAAAPSSSRLTWPSGRGHLPVRVSFTEKARALHARMAWLYMDQLRVADPRAFEEWVARYKPLSASQ
ncbi:hypothetical protein [Streptomyces alanosinicus]|uniref:Uncharacterized protein n=1 Tax=Streptomyces alanosinicus TaxID=68171 RepID=A0A919D5A3_9ACTN|nr:hypothetical protein [Streptomyces alanosinicus]GHE09213.1 hypothetical protein GCM10010339_60720 [Streptomyces alanosinicus]